MFANHSPDQTQRVDGRTMQLSIAWSSDGASQPQSSVPAAHLVARAARL